MKMVKQFSESQIDKIMDVMFKYGCNVSTAIECFYDEIFNK